MGEQNAPGGAGGVEAVEIPPVSSQPSSSILRVQCLLHTWGYSRTYCALMGGVKELAYGVLLSMFPRNTCRGARFAQRNASGAWLGFRVPKASALS